MRIIHTLDEMTETARGWLAGGSVGFVPTMGYLHEGHMSLVEAARNECEISVVSIFVNPLQFATPDEFESYPRDLTRDLQMLHAAQVDVVFVPRDEDFFPPNFSTTVQPSGTAFELLEGASNPSYASGVATAVTKLLQLVRPDVVYFGRKDAQQVVLARRIIRDLNIDVSLRSMPTIRESDGLALSSRNHLLVSDERRAANVLYRALQSGKALVESGEIRPDIIEQAMASQVATEPLVTLEYAVACHETTFEPVPRVVPGTMLAIAATIGGIRLIDNTLWLGDDHWLS